MSIGCKSAWLGKAKVLGIEVVYVMVVSRLCSGRSMCLEMKQCSNGCRSARFEEANVTKNEMDVSRLSLITPELGNKMVR